MSQKVRMCTVFDNLTGEERQVPCASTKSPATSSLVRAIRRSQIMTSILFLIVVVAVSLAISVSAIEIQAAFPTVSRGLSISLIVFSSLAIVLFIVVAVLSSQKVMLQEYLKHAAYEEENVVRNPPVVTVQNPILVNTT